MSDSAQSMCWGDFLLLQDQNLVKFLNNGLSYSNLCFCLELDLLQKLESRYTTND